MRLLDDRRTLRGACRLVSAAQRHLGLKARLLRCPAGEDDQIEIGLYTVTPEEVPPEKGGWSLVRWALDVAVATPATRWDPPDVDIVELGSFVGWPAVLSEIAAIEAREDLANRMEWDAEREYRRAGS